MFVVRLSCLWSTPLMFVVYPPLWLWSIPSLTSQWFAKLLVCEPVKLLAILITVEYLKKTKSHKGLCKVKQIPKKPWIELTPTHPPPPPSNFFWKPSLTWTEHSNHNNQTLLAMYIQTEYTWYTTPKYQYWLRAILRRFSTKKIPSETWTHPPTSIVISDFWRKKFLCNAPNLDIS